MNAYHEQCYWILRVIITRNKNFRWYHFDSECYVRWFSITPRDRRIVAFPLVLTLTCKKQILPSIELCFAKLSIINFLGMLKRLRYLLRWETKHVFLTSTYNTTWFEGWYISLTKTLGIRIWWVGFLITVSGAAYCTDGIWHRCYSGWCCFLPVGRTT